MIRTGSAICHVGALVGLLFVSSAGEAAESKVRAGTLECDVSAGVGLIIVEKQTMTCTFTPSGGGPVDRYKGKIEEVGITLGATAAGVIIWGVLAAQKGVPHGALAGTYGGLGADASLGLGLGANILIGGTGRAFMLQPLSIEGQAGLNVAAGITTITLRSEP